MKIKIEFATDGEHNYALGYIIVAENEEEEQTLNIIRDMHFFGDIKYAGVARTDNNNVNKLMFEHPTIIRRCISGTLNGTICKDHAESITCSKNDFAPHLSITDFKELVKSQFEILD